LAWAAAGVTAIRPPFLESVSEDRAGVLSLLQVFASYKDSCEVGRGRVGEMNGHADAVRRESIAAVVAVGLWLLLPGTAQAQPLEVECGEVIPAGEGEAAQGIVRANLSLAEGELTTLPFGRSRRPDTFEVQFDVEGCTFERRPVEVATRIFRRGGAALPRDRLTVEANAEREFVILSVTVNPGSVDPGSYTGEVIFIDPAVNRFELPLAIEFQFEHWWLLAVGLIAVILPLGTFLVWSAGGLNWDRREWPKTLVKIIVATGAGGAAYYAAYWRNPTWGADGWDFILLAGVVLTAYMSALTSSSALSGRQTPLPGKDVTGDTVPSKAAET
jgi:hypothetical protein